jgi:hypothetical protein
MMADDAHEERFRQHEDILRSLTVMLMRMDGYLANQASINVEPREFNRQQVEINTDVKTTLARIETLLARMLRTDGNGREA